MESELLGFQQLQLALLLSIEPQLLLLLLLPLPKMGNPQELSAPRIISAALSLSAPVSLIAGVLRLPLQVLRLTLSMSQVAATLVILTFKLWFQLLVFLLRRDAPQALTAVYLHESWYGCR